MSVGSTRRHEGTDDASAIHCTSVAALGCEVIGAVIAPCGSSTSESATDSSFVRWIDSGHRLEDWDAGVLGDEGGTAA